MLQTLNIEPTYKPFNQQICKYKTRAEKRFWLDDISKKINC